VNAEQSAQTTTQQGKRHSDGQADEDEQQNRKVLLKH
jgi:hypothetical protein